MIFKRSQLTIANNTQISCLYHFKIEILKQHFQHALFLFFNQRKMMKVIETYVDVSPSNNVNISSVDSKMVNSMSTAKVGKCRFASIITKIQHNSRQNLPEN